MKSYLHSVHRAGSEGSVGKRLGRSQNVPDPIEVMLVLFNGLNTQSIFGQNCLITRGITGRRKEFKVSMPSTKKKPNSVMAKKVNAFLNLSY